MKPKTGVEIIKELYLSQNTTLHAGANISAMIDSNTALAVAEATLKYQDDYDHSVREHEKCKAHCDYITQELELCKAHNLMLSDKLKIIGSAELPWSLQDVQELVHATKETIEAYRNEIVQKAKSEQRDSDVKSTRTGLVDNKGE